MKMPSKPKADTRPEFSKPRQLTRDEIGALHIDAVETSNEIQRLMKTGEHRKAGITQ